MAHIRKAVMRKSAPAASLTNQSQLKTRRPIPQSTNLNLQQNSTRQPPLNPTQPLRHSLTHIAITNSSSPQKSPHLIQLKIGDGHDLKSARFAGDEVLEGCYDGEKTRYLRNGSTGEAVKKIQQALIDLKYPMPISTQKTGEPDGIYGAETSKTVKQFQTDQALKDKDGIVGKDTIEKLDQLLGTGPSPKPPEPPEPSTQELILQVVENADAATIATLRKDAKFLDSSQSLMTNAQFGKLAALLILVVPDKVVSKTAAKNEAVRILSAQLGGDKAIARRTIDKNIFVVIVPKDTLMTDLSEFSSLKGVKTFDGREWETTRGVGGITIGGKVYTAITEENLLGEDCTATYKGKPVSGFYTKGYSTTSHEFAHTLHLFVLEKADQKIITDAYNARKAIAKTKPDDPDQWVDGREGCYASQTEAEFFAQLSNAYLGTNTGNDPSTGDPRQNTKDWVKNP